MYWRALTTKNCSTQNISTAKVGKLLFKRNQKLEKFPKSISTKCFANQKPEPTSELIIPPSSKVVN
jgi:hypothetical protein